MDPREPPNAEYARTERGAAGPALPPQNVPCRPIESGGRAVVAAKRPVYHVGAPARADSSRREAGGEPVLLAVARHVEGAVEADRRRSREGARLGVMGVGEAAKGRKPPCPAPPAALTTRPSRSAGRSHAVNHRRARRSVDRVRCSRPRERPVRNESLITSTRPRRAP